jgi:[phosphatase 2A protein]-leucine-carboxy methyltransferase
LAGTYVRTTGIDRVVDSFLSSAQEGRKQIISLGAGSDTRYFRLKQKRRKLDLVYHELDFEANNRRKIAHMRGDAFASAAKEHAGVDMRAEDAMSSQDGSALVTIDYLVHSQDLRQLPRRDVPLPGIDTTLPTLIISECCLVYLPPDDADAVLRYFSNLFPETVPLAIVIYEPIRPHDPFGKTMISNLASRGLQLQTLEKYHDLKEQIGRLRTYGFGGESQRSSGGAEAADIDFIWQKWISSEEKERVEGLEWMDEVEEFVLLAKHYCISWGWRGFAAESPWKELPLPSR